MASANGRITKIVPTPRPVTLAGRAFDVHECRISDLADLQSWLELGHPDPIDLCPEAAFAPDAVDSARMRLIEATLDAWVPPPSWGSDEARARYATAEGCCFLAHVALRRGHPDLTVGDIVDVVRDATPAEFARLRRAFFGVDSYLALERVMLGAADGGDGATVPWCKAVDEIARSHHWTYPQIYALTLTEWRNARRGGEPESDEVEMSHAEWQAYIARKNRADAPTVSADTTLPGA